MNLLLKLAAASGNKIIPPGILNDGNTVGWYRWDDESSISKDASNLIASWSDKLNSGKNLSQATDVNKPIWTKEGIYLDTPSKGLQVTSILSTQPFVIYMIFRQLTWVSGLRLIRSVPAEQPAGTLYQFGTSPQLAVHTGSAAIGNNSNLAIGDWGVFRYQMSGASSYSAVNDNAPVAANFGTNNMPGLAVGTPDGQAASAPKFFIKELIVRKVADNTQNANDIVSYLIKRKNQISPKMVSFGDSITAQNLWQPTIAANHPELAYNSYESITGVGSYPKTGVGGSRIVPLINNSNTGQTVNNSIYERADFVKNYYPSLILLLGGVNDLVTGGASVGSLSDPVYTGAAVTSNPPSFYSAYKGVLKKLTEQNSKARIICLTPFYTTAGNIQFYVNAVKDCANLYGLQCLDLFANVPINSSNHLTYLSDGVHPNATGGQLIGNYISNYI